MANRKMSPTMPLHALGVTLCLTLLGIGYWIGIRPTASLQSNEAELTQAYAQARTALRDGEVKLRRLEGKAEQLQRKQAAHSLVLQSPSQLNAQLAELSSLAESCGLKANKTKVGELQAADDHRFYQIELGGNGPLTGFSQMLDRVHADHPDVAVQVIDLTRDASTGQARFELKLLWFVAEPYQSTASVSAPTPE